MKLAKMRTTTRAELAHIPDWPQPQRELRMVYWSQRNTRWAELRWTSCSNASPGYSWTTPIITSSKTTSISEHQRGADHVAGRGTCGVLPSNGGTCFATPPSRRRGAVHASPGGRAAVMAIPMFDANALQAICDGIDDSGVATKRHRFFDALSRRPQRDRSGNNVGAFVQRVRLLWGGSVGSERGRIYSGNDVSPSPIVAPVVMTARVKFDTTTTGRIPTVSGPFTGFSGWDYEAGWYPGATNGKMYFKIAEFSPDDSDDTERYATQEFDPNVWYVWKWSLSQTEIKGKAWRDGDPEPDWQISFVPHGPVTLDVFGIGSSKVGYSDDTQNFDYDYIDFDTAAGLSAEQTSKCER